MEQLVKDIIKAKEARGLNDAELAELLGIDAATWSKIQSGDRRPGAKFLSALVREFPELQVKVLLYMSQKREPVGGSGK